MNVLFVGEKDIAGRYVAEKLFKENNKVYWLTESEEGGLWDTNVKGKIYRTDIKSHKCIDIFTVNNIDTVIFLTGKHREYSDDQFYVDYESIIPGLMNVLKISKECNINKFIFLSSMQLFNSNINSPILSDLMSGEMLCDLWKNKFGMNMLVFRISSIYGVYDYDNMDYTGYICNKMIRNESIETNLNKNESIDLIYGEDTAETIYRHMTSGSSGIFKVYNGSEVKVEKYFNVLASICNYTKRITFKNTFNKNEKITSNRPEQNVKQTKENRHKFEDNISIILEKAKNYNESINNNKIKKELNVKRTSKFTDYFRSLGENILLFVLSCVLLNFTQKYTDFRFIDVRLVYVVIISCIYGVRQGLIASILSCISYGYSIIMSGIDLSYLLYSMDTWTPFIMYLIAGPTVGYIIDAKNEELDEQKKKYLSIDENYKFLKELYKEACDVKNQLQKQIIASKNSFWRVHEIVSELDTFKANHIFFKAINILEDVMETDTVSIYAVNLDNLNYARLIANSSSLAGKLDSSLKLANYPLLKKAIEDKTMFVNKQLLDGYPTYAAPILDGDKVIAIAMTYNTGLERFTLYYQNLFNIVIQMIQSNLVKAYKYSEATYEELYIRGTRIYNPVEFENQMKIVKMAKEELNLPYIVGKVKTVDGRDNDSLDISKRLESVLRSTDFIGCDDNKNYYAVLMQTGKENFNIILERFNKVGLELIREEAV